MALEVKQPDNGGGLYLPFRRLTLQIRLAVWTCLMFVVLCLGLLIFVNLTAGEGRSNQLQGVSFIGFVLVAALGGAGAYWLAGAALRPLKEVSRAVHTISVHTLDTRLNLSGPQDELKELAQAFDAMLDRLETNFEQQRRFTANAAHELRTPLAIMRTNLEVIAADKEATLADYHGLTATLERGLSRLEKLVADLLTLAAHTSTLTRDEIELGTILEEVLDELRPVAQAAQVNLTLDNKVEATITGDTILLNRIFSNLVENAIRYNRPQGRVWVEIKRDNEWAIITIGDTGLGIALADQNHIFERFYRSDQSRSRNSGGAGLGLSIVHHLVQQHSGQVVLLASSPQGSTFQVRLPLVLPKTI